MEDTSFPSDRLEERESFVGISENVVHDVTFKILNISTNILINRSNLRLANDSKFPSLRSDPVAFPEVIALLREDNFEAEDATSKTSPNEEDPGSENTTKDSSSNPSSSRHMPVVDTNDIVGRTLFLNKECGQRLRARIIKALDDFDGDLARHSSRLKFI